MCYNIDMEYQHHVHLFVRAWPTTSAAEVVKQVKGITSHELRGKYPHLLKLPSLWTRSYFIQNRPGDPTSARALRMMTSAQLMEIRRRVGAIECMIRTLQASPEPGRLELIRLAYWDGRYTVKGICDELSISERTYYRWRREAL